MLRSTVRTAVLGAVGAVLLGGAVSCTPTTAAQPCPTPAGSVIRSAPGAGKTVALTFDDGPGPFTPRILAILRQYNVRATFFDTGQHDAQFPQYTKEIAGEGHLLGDHTWEHDYPSSTNAGWSAGYLDGQFDRTNTQQALLTGRNTCFFRPPGGFLPSSVVSAARSRRMSTVLWSVDTEDWKQPGYTSSAAVARIVANASAGLSQAHPIVLMHTAKASHEPESQVSSNRSNDLLALPQIIRMYESHGYRFVDLFGASGLSAGRYTMLSVGTVSGRVPAGTATTAISGSLSTVSGPVANVPVAVYSRPHGGRTWTLRGSVDTDRNGNAAFTDRPTAPTEYTMRFGGTPGYAAATTSGVRTVMTDSYPTVVTAAASPATVTVGDSAILTAVVTSSGRPRTGVPVRLASSDPTDQGRILTTDAAGRITASVTPASSVTYTFTVAQTLPYLAGSTTVSVAVTPADVTSQDPTPAP